ncbi:putative ribonuclease H-like domain-containing protein [Tanacetum coccineum]
MSAKDKNGLGYGTQSDEMSNKSKTDSEISMSVFEVRSSDEETTPANNRFSKADGYHAVPPPIIGNFLTLRADISFAGLDKYAIREKIIESKTTKLNTDTSKSKTGETVGKTNEVNIEKPKSVHESVVPKPKFNRDKVIIEDWYSDDEDDVSEVNTVSPVKTNQTQIVKTQVDKSGQIYQKEGIGFKKIKACFVCKSTNHLIKDCDFYAKNSPKPKMKIVVNTGQRVVKLVWDNAKRVNHQKISNKLKYPQARRTFVPSGVLTRTGLVNPVRPNEKRAVHTVSTARPISTARVKNMTTAGTRVVVNTVKGKMDNDLKKSRWGNLEICLQDHAVVDSGCSSHMTGNKAYLLDYEDYNGGFVAFGSDPKGGKITGKGKIRTANLDFDDVYFVNELKFNLFSISQICDKKNSVLFTSTECLILSPSFKLLDENQVVLRAPRQNGVYSLDLKNIVPSGEFKNHAMNELCAKKGIKGEFSVARTPQQNGVAERKNRTLIKAARSMLADSLLPISFWAEAVNTACYVLNKVNVDAGTQEHYVAGSSEKDKELTQEYILLPLHPHRPRILVEDVVQAAQEKPSKNSPKDNDVQDSEDVAKKEEQHTLTEAEQVLKDDLERMIAQEIAAKAIDDATRQAFEVEKKRAAQATSINKLNTGQIPIDASTLPNVDLPIDPNMPNLEDDSNVLPNDGIFSGAYDDEDVGAEADFNNMDNTIDVSPIPTLRVHKDHPKGQILGDPKSENKTNHKDHQNCLLAWFLSQEEPKTISQALKDEIWVEAMQEELLQFKLQKVWILVDLPFGKKAIGTKWVFKNKRDERSIIVKNKARIVAQGFRQEEGIDYDEVFTPVARIEAIRLFLAFASFMGFPIYQMDVKSAFHYDTIEEEVYVHQPPGFVNPDHTNKVYKVIKALYGLHQAPRAWYETLSSFQLKNSFRRGTIDKTLFIKKKKNDIMLVQVYVDDIIFGSTTQSMCTGFEDCMHKRFQMSSMGELTFFLGLQVKQQPDGIFISQDKYVADILKKFDFCSIKTATTPITSNKPLVKDEDGIDVDVHVCMSMIGSRMYLTASRPDIMFAVCAYARFQVTLKASYLNAVKRIFSYLKHQPKLGLWYPKDSPFELKAFSDSDYGGASLDRKSTTGGCQFLSRRLISWQCKKQTIMENSTTKVEYVATANYCRQVLWIQNKMMDYGFNFMNTKIHIDNESTICIVKNPVYHSRTMHIEIRHHFIRDCYEKRLIDVIKIHTNANVVDLLTKGFNANLMLPGKFDAARQIWCCQANLVLSGKFGAARQKFVLLVTVTTVGEQNRFSLIKYNR